MLRWSGWARPSFGADEIEAIHGAIDTICPLSAWETSDETYTPLWRSIDNGMQMPVRAAAVTAGEPTPEEAEWALERTLDADRSPS